MTDSGELTFWSAKCHVFQHRDEHLSQCYHSRDSGWTNVCFLMSELRTHWLRRWRVAQGRSRRRSCFTWRRL